MPIPHNRLRLDSAERTAALRVIDSGYLGPGPEVEAFEREFCDAVGLPDGHAVALSSGTAALYLSMRVLKVTNAAYPVYFCSAVRNASRMAGAKETLLDVGVDLPLVEIAGVPQTSCDAVVVPHMFGIPVICNASNGISVIEDCSHALGATVSGSPVGQVGGVGVYSFAATKLITTGGQGGMLVSSDRALVDAVRDYREYDCRRDDLPRFNFQMSDLHAAIGRAQLGKLPHLISRREEIFGQYRSAGIDLLGADLPVRGITPVRYRAIWLCSDPERVRERLAELGVSTIVPVRDWELLGPSGMFPSAHAWTQRTLSLPVYPNLSDTEVNLVIRCVLQARDEVGE